MRLYSVDGSGRSGSLLRWTAAGLVMAALHGGAGWLVLTHSFVVPMPPLPDGVQGITMDLEPVSVPQNAPEPSATPASSAAPTVDQAPEPPPAVEPSQVAPPEAAPLVPPAAPSQASAAPSPVDPEPPPAPLAEAPAVGVPPERAVNDAILAPVPAIEAQRPPTIAVSPPNAPTPRQALRRDSMVKSQKATPPAPPKPPKPKPDPRRIAEEQARREALARDRAVAERQAAEARRRRQAERAQARTQAAAQVRESGGRANPAEAPSGEAAGAAIAAWRGEVMARLHAAKPVSPNGASGTARVAFGVDRGGRVVSASLASSSGDGSLDAAAVSMVRRAGPFPAPPPELGARVSLTVPVWFH